MTKDALVADFDKYIDANGGIQAGYGWYVGITGDPRRRLFKDHRVDEVNGVWIYGQLESASVAREVEKHYLLRGCQGGSGGGDHTASCVYAYRITLNTEESTG